MVDTSETQLPQVSASASTIRNQVYRTTGCQDLNQLAQEPTVGSRFLLLEPNTANTWTRNTNLPSSSVAKTRSNWRGRRIVMITWSGVRQMESGTLATFDAKAQFARTRDDQAMVSKWLGATSKDPRFSSVAAGQATS